MIHGLLQSMIILAVIMVAFALDFVLMNRYESLRQANRSKRAWSWDYTLFVMIASLLLISQPSVFPAIGFYTPQRWGLYLQIAGLVCMDCALILHVWARLHLRHFYAERVEVQADHRLVDTGPYRLVRHPIIVSFFGLAIGLFLFNPAIPAFLMLLYTFWDFLHAARQEDELLSTSLPGYGDYKLRTPAFFPRIWAPGKRK
jgi:protein-S-isoprenylcysteine O-methyltransferase Ste14